MPLLAQIIWLIVLALPIAAISWTITHEEIFREFQNYARRQNKDNPRPVIRKFFYAFTCEYCFSHYVTIVFLSLTHYQLLYQDWRGYVIGGFSLVWVANIHMSLYALIRTNLRVERTEADLLARSLEKNKSQES